MNRPVFADTSFWIAFSNPRDSRHTIADAIFSLRPIVTSEMVLVEFLNYFSGRGAEARGVMSQYAETLRKGDEVHVVPQTSELFERALKLYSARRDKAWSLTDCSSFVIMAQFNLTEALTHDAHFEQAGFKALLRG